MLILGMIMIHGSRCTAKYIFQNVPKVLKEELLAYLNLSSFNLL